MWEKILEGYDHFLEEGSSYVKNECNLLYRKLDAKYFYFKSFFRKKQYFPRKLQKTILRATLTLF